MQPVAAPLTVMLATFFATFSATFFATLLATPACFAVPAAAGPTLIDGRYALRRYTHADGLPVDGVTGVGLARDGALWVATLDGLARFDGYRFEPLRKRQLPSLPSNRLARIRFAANGDLWFETETYDIGRLHGSQLEVFRPGAALAQIANTWAVVGDQAWVGVASGLWSLTSGAAASVALGAVDAAAIRHVGPDPRGGAWIERFDGSLLRVPANGPTQRVAVPARIGKLTMALPRKGGGWWLGGEQGMVRVVGKDVTAITAATGEAILKGTYDAWSAEDGSAWFATPRGWWRVSGPDASIASPMAPEPWPEPNLTATSTRWPRHDPRQGRYFATKFQVFDGANRVVNLTDASSHGVVEPTPGHAWIGSTAGLVHVWRQPILQVGTPEGMAEPNSYAVLAGAQAEPGAWIGTWGAGLAHLGLADAATVTVRNLRLSAQAPIEPWRLGLVTALGRDTAGDLMVGHGGGACLLRGDQCTPMDIGLADVAEGEVRLLQYDPAGRLWVSRPNVLLVATPGASGVAQWRQIREVAGKATRFARALAPLADGRVLVATATAGVLAVDANTMRSVGRAEGLASDNVRALRVDEDLVWVGTEDAGLCALDATSLRVVGCVDREDGLGDDVVHAIERDGVGRLWLSGNRGLFWLDRAALAARLRDSNATALAPVTFDERDGLRHAEFNGGGSPSSAQLGDGRLLFPGQAGIAIVDPRLVPVAAPPTATIDLATIDRATIEQPTAGARVVSFGAIVASATQAAADPLSLALTDVERTVSLHWSAVALADGDDVVYRYRLEGVDGRWVGPTRDRTIRYSALPPGPRRFEVQAGVGGRWQAVGATLTIDRAFTLRERPIFPWLIAAMMLLLGVVAWRVRARAMLARQRVLEQQVHDRTRALAASNETLARQSTRLAAVDALRQRFVGNVSHELRTPLMLIEGAIRDVRALTADDDDSSRRLDVALRGTDRLKGMVEQLLAAARVDRDDAPVVVRRVDLRALAQSVVARFADAAASAGVALQGPGHGPAVWLFASVDVIETAMTNLLANALKFTPAGGSVQVKVDPGDDDALFATLQVIDSGMGVPERDLPHIFERFYQVERDDGGERWGSGIGLSLVHELVGRSGGDVAVQSQQGQGSCFEIRLPKGVAHLDLSQIDLSEPDAEPSEGPIEARPPVRTALPADDTGSFGDGELPLLLLVEDHPDMRAYLAEHFRETFDVLTAADGLEGLAMARAHQPAVIVSDVMMPKLDGLGLCMQLRADPSIASIPVVLVSAKADVEDRASALIVADDYLTKPVAIPELLARVRRLLRRRRAELDAVAAAGNARPDDPVSKSAAAPQAADGALQLPRAEPDSRDRARLSEHDRAYLARLDEVIATHLADPGFGVHDLARKMAQSDRQLLRDLRRLLDQGASETLRGRRLEHARTLLERGSYATVAEVAAAVGLSPTYFTRAYAAWFGEVPSTTLRGSN